jgi:transposase
LEQAEHIVRQRTTLVLLLHQQPLVSNSEAAARVQLHLRSVQRWRRRWATGDFSLEDEPGRGRKAAFSPLDQALVKAVACELIAETKQPLSRQSLADVTAQARQALGKPISRSTVWRILDTDAIKPWQYQYWIFPRDPHFVEKAGPILDLYAGMWHGQPLGPKDHILSADEKTSIQARIRVRISIRRCPGAGFTQGSTTVATA